MSVCSYCKKAIRSGQKTTTIDTKDGVVFAHMHREDCKRSLAVVEP